MPRTEFSRKTRREALRRSGKRCEAYGERYGLDPLTHCHAKLDQGVEFDHILEAELGGDNSLENCAAVCPACHKVKTRRGIQEIRKADRVRDKASGAWKRKSRPMDGSRASKWKRKIDGTVERRKP